MYVPRVHTYIHLIIIIFLAHKVYRVFIFFFFFLGPETGFVCPGEAVESLIFSSKLDNISNLNAVVMLSLLSLLRTKLMIFFLGYVSPIESPRK